MKELHSFVATLVYSMLNKVPFHLACSNPTTRLVALKKTTKSLMVRVDPPLSVVLLALKLLHRQKLDVFDKHIEMRILVTSINLSMKYLCDLPYTNLIWSNLTRIPLNDFNNLESVFLSNLNFNLHIKHDEFENWVIDIQQYYDSFEILVKNSKKISI
jgi:hypothetical protein